MLSELPPKLARGAAHEVQPLQKYKPVCRRHLALPVAVHRCVTADHLWCLSVLSPRGICCLGRKWKPGCSLPESSKTRSLDPRVVSDRLQQRRDMFGGPLQRALNATNSLETAAAVYTHARDDKPGALEVFCRSFAAATHLSVLACRSYTYASWTTSTSLHRNLYLGVETNGAAPYTRYSSHVSHLAARAPMQLAAAVGCLTVCQQVSSPTCKFQLRHCKQEQQKACTWCSRAAGVQGSQDRIDASHDCCSEWP